MARVSLKDPPEVFVSTAAMSAAASRAAAAGKLRRLGSRLYTTDLTEDAAVIVRRHLWEIAAGYFPGGLVAIHATPLNISRRQTALFFSSRREAATSNCPA